MQEDMRTHRRLEALLESSYALPQSPTGLASLRRGAALALDVLDEPSRASLYLRRFVAAVACAELRCKSDPERAREWLKRGREDLQLALEELGGVARRRA